MGTALDGIVASLLVPWCCFHGHGSATLAEAI